MKFVFSASSILFCAFILTGCDSLGIPNMMADDQVPDAVKAQPRLVQTPEPAMIDASGWPRLGDVPVKPKDFSPKPVYDHYMNEMEFHRDEAEAYKRQAEDEDPTLSNAPLPDHPVLRPPQLPKE